MRLAVLTVLAASALLARPAAAHCYDQAVAAYGAYGVTEVMLRGIAEVESSGNPEAMNMSHKARTRSYDIGLVQSNSRWLPTLQRHGISEQALRDPCQNLLVGAWILASNMQRFGANWTAVGAYNAACTELRGADCERARNTYNWKVYRAIQRQASIASRPTASGLAPVHAQAQQEARPRRIQRTSNEPVELASVTARADTTND